MPNSGIFYVEFRVETHQHIKSFLVREWPVCISYGVGGLHSKNIAVRNLELHGDRFVGVDICI